MAFPAWHSGNQSTKTVTLDEGAYFDALAHLDVEKQLRAAKGVLAAAANPDSTSVIARFDETVMTFEHLRQTAEDCGYHCRGKATARHVGPPHTVPTRPKSAGVYVAHNGHEVAKSATTHDAMAQEMGHGAGGDMHATVRDMRDRFFISLIYTLPIFALAPKGLAAIVIGLGAFAVWFWWLGQPTVADVAVAPDRDPCRPRREALGPDRHIRCAVPDRDDPVARHNAKDAPEPVVGDLYKFIAVPIAAGVFYPFLLSPEIAAISMSGSSALVAVNALLLKRTAPGGHCKSPAMG